MRKIQKIQKVIALLLAMMMLMTAMAGCGDNKGNEGNEGNMSESQEDSNSGDEELYNDPYAEAVTLKYVLPLAGEEFDDAAMLAALNKITQEKINATIEIEWIPLDEYTDKMNMKFTSGEKFDLCFTGAWNPYLQAVSKGAYAELTTDVLNTYAPEFMAMLNPAAWEAVTVDGKIYGAPIQQIYVRQSGLYIATELADKYGLNIDAVASLDDVDDYLASVKGNEADIVPFFLTDWTDLTSYLGWDPIVGVTTPGVVRFDDETPVVVNQFETEEFKALCEKMREWSLAGYLPSDILTGSDSGRDKTWATSTNPAVKPGGDVTESAGRGYEVKSAPIGTAVITTSAVNATITAVSATSENVERAVAFINLLNTDADVLNTICHGVEGTDWNFVDEENKVIELISDYPTSNYSFFIGNVFNEYYTDATLVGTWEATAELNNNAPGSCILGFSFNSEPVATEIAQCSAVINEYLKPVVFGAVEVEQGIADLVAALDGAGADEIIAEMQSQIDAWANK